MIPVHYYLTVGALLFAIGTTIVLVRRNTLFVLMGIELILNAATINFVGAAQWDTVKLSGHMMTMMIIVLAVCEAVVALAIIMVLYKKVGTVDLSELKQLKES